MRQVTRKGLITIAAAGGVLAISGGHAHADADAQGAAVGSPGVLSGNTVQAPVHAPVNACGNTVTVGGGLNPAFGNRCANEEPQAESRDEGGHGKDHEGGHHGGHQSPDARKPAGGHHERAGGHHEPAVDNGGAEAEGVSQGSPGVLSGNTVQVPVHAPVNVCGNSVNVVGALNPAVGNTCVNDSEPAPEQPGEPEEPEQPNKPEEPNKPGKPEQPKDEVEPRTETPEREAGKPAPEVMGGELAETGVPGLGTILPVGAGALLGGTVLYRRARLARR